MDEQPAAVDSDSGRRVMEVTWDDGSVSSIPWRYLRQNCPCAGCSGEMSGEPSEAVDFTDAQVAINSVTLAGHYAIQPVWADGHMTGIYPWKLLRKLGDEVGERG